MGYDAFHGFVGDITAGGEIEHAEMLKSPIENKGLQFIVTGVVGDGEGTWSVDRHIIHHVR